MFLNYKRLYFLVCLSYGVVVIYYFAHNFMLCQVVSILFAYLTFENHLICSLYFPLRFWIWRHNFGHKNSSGVPGNKYSPVLFLRKFVPPGPLGNLYSPTKNTLFPRKGVHPEKEDPPCTFTCMKFCNRAMYTLLDFQHFDFD